MEIIQEVGSYAGFAAVVGLAVLSALYFSQARDVRRLREWAGRAPERAAEQAPPGAAAPEQAAQHAVRPARTGAVRPIPAAKPAAAAAAGAPPATATQPGQPGQQKPPGPPKPPGSAPPVPATAAANANSPQAGPGAPAPGSPAAAPGTPAPASPGGAAPAPPGGAKPALPGGGQPTSPGGGQPASPGAAPGAAPRPATPAAAPAGPGTAVHKPPAPVASPPARPPLPGRVPAGPVRPAPAGRPAGSGTSQRTAVLPAATRLRDSDGSAPSGRGGLSGRYIALIVAGVIVIGGGLAFGISQMGGDDSATAPEGQGAAPEPADPGGPVNPSTVTVSVLNGTTVPGLAAQIGDDVEAGGFQRGNVANATDQQRAESVVLYREGAEREARLVARRLQISQIEPVDQESQALAGNASVVVVVGADRTQ